jgi:alpha-beta hydrolase superfamily lysophospholipase
MLDRKAFGKYNARITNPRTDFDWLSRDNAVVDAYVADPLCGRLSSAGLFRDLLDGMGFFTRPRNLARMKKDLPVYFLSGDCDPVGEYGEGVIRTYKSFLKAGMTNVTMKLYHGARHEIINELNRGRSMKTSLNGWTAKWEDSTSSLEFYRLPPFIRQKAQIYRQKQLSITSKSGILCICEVEK